MYFLTNSGLIAIAIGLDARRSPLAVWREHFLWLSVNYFAAASVSFCLVLLMYQSNLLAAIVFVPLLVVLHLTLRSSFGRLDDARQHLAHLDRLYLSTVETLAMAIDAKDDVTHSHVRRVQAYSLGLARELGVTDEATLKGIEAAALLHDTGKLAVPEHILNKPGKLSEAEFEQMKRHVDVGADILSLVDFPYPVVPIVRCHHENWDGSWVPARRRRNRHSDWRANSVGGRLLRRADVGSSVSLGAQRRSGIRHPPRAPRHDVRAARGRHLHPRASRPGRADGVVSGARRAPADYAVGCGTEPGAAHGRSARGRVGRHPGLRQPGASRVGRRVNGDVLSLSSGLMRELAPTATIGWFVMDEASGYLALRHASGPAAGQMKGTSLRLGEGVSGWVAANRQVIINSEASLDLGERAFSGSPLKHALSVPLITRESLVGTITLYSETAFTESQSRLVQVIAPHLAQAIWTAKRAEGAAHASHAQGNRAAGATHPDMRLVSTR